MSTDRALHRKYFAEKRRAEKAEALAAEMRGELDKLIQELHDSKYLAAARLKMNNELVERAETAEALAASRKELLRRCRDAIASQAENLIECLFFEEAAHFEELEKELAKELGDD